jgi:hypothetical protein
MSTPAVAIGHAHKPRPSTPGRATIKRHTGQADFTSLKCGCGRVMRFKASTDSGAAM